MYEKEDIVEELTNKVIDSLMAQGYLNERKIRNARIKREYVALRNQGTKMDEAIMILSQRTYINSEGQNYRLGSEAIRKIVYADKR